MSQLNLPCSEIANKHYRIDSLFSAQGNRSSHNKRNTFYFLVVIWSVAVHVTYLCRATLKSHPLWLVGKGARVRKWQTTEAKIKGLWPETLLGCWCGDSSKLDHSLSCPYCQSLRFTLIIFSLVYDSAPLVEAIFRISCWHEWQEMRSTCCNE